MKRFVTLMLAFALVIGAVANSSAADIKAKGQMDFAFQWTDNTNFKDTDEDGTSEDDFAAMQRVRTQIDIVASENLSGVLFFEIGTENWGRGGADLGTDGVNIETRRAYIDFKVPSTELNVRMGLQSFVLPSAALAPPVLDSDAAGITLSYPITDTVAANFMWVRAEDGQAADTTASVSSSDDEVDVFAATMSLDFDTIKVQPWAAYAAYGSDANANNFGGDADAWWLGVAFEADVIENLFFDLDITYGAADVDDADDHSGWAFASKIGYKMDMFTPVLFGFYTTGADDNNDTTDRLPTIAGDQPNGTSFGTDAAFYDTTDSLLNANAGMWSIGFALEDISFIEDLTHVVRIAYYRGTNDDDFRVDTADANGQILTEDDDAWEVNIDTKYQIYENLSAAVELGWVHVDIDDIDDTDDAWKAAVGFSYTF